MYEVMALNAGFMPLRARALKLRNEIPIAPQILTIELMFLRPQGSNRTDLEVTLWTFVREVLCLILGRDTGYTE
jgi:hypothetical protein